ncbi:hypothetical protein [Kocuria aegyptia]|uniref:DUF4229 domain-containing protein n=1 Tax=Kocuria aegyptia TaxID=330943 RepID=A0ABP4X1V2_9MICC
MATGKAPISGGFAIVCALWFVAMVVIAFVADNFWTTVLSSLALVAIALVNWRGFKRHDREYRERMERLDERLGRGT